MAKRKKQEGLSAPYPMKKWEEDLYWIGREKEEQMRDGGLQTNFGMLIPIINTATRLFPSLFEDEDIGSYGANARMLLEDMEMP